MGRAYYNEIDPFAAAWLRELIRAGEIAPGDVDERSIEDVTPSDLLGYTQCHFFAGIGVWSRALRSAGWPDDRQAWTGSCPCQPFSAAGKGKGVADERHLWPAFFHLIEVCGPELVFGEQVAGKDGLGWLDLVSTDLEAVGYACGAVPAPAAGFGAPHIRERLYWVADAEVRGREPRSGNGSLRIQDDGAGAAAEQLGASRASGRLADANSDGCCEGERNNSPMGHRPAIAADRQPFIPSPTNGVWRVADWLYCRDGKWRPVEPGTFPLAHGSAARVGRLRGYGNAIVAPAAQAFIESVMEVIDATQPA